MKSKVSKSWYVKSQEQLLLFNPTEVKEMGGLPPIKDPNKPEAEFDYSGNYQEDIEYAKDLQEIEGILDHYNIEYEERAFKNGINILVIKSDKPIKTRYSNAPKYPVYIIDDFNFPRLVDAQWWIDKIDDFHLDEYLDFQDQNKEFWDGVGSEYYVYHGTSKNNVESILKHGLEPRDETRGLRNTGMGPAVFTSPDFEKASYYFDVVIQINVGRMKADGYMPEVSLEDPVKESEMRNSIANYIEFEDYHSEETNDYDPGTVAFFGRIPPKYLKLVEE